MDYCDCVLSSLSTSSASASASASSGLSSYSTSVLTPKNNKNNNNNSAKKQRPSAACKYKGVVPQPNGRWGAQLYNGNKRVWIGTYDCQHEAAHAYDMAVIRFRGAQAITNYPICHYGRPHLEFLCAHTHTRVIDMLRNHTYEEELARFMRARLDRKPDQGSSGSVCQQELLFKKVMTPSDVGRLHRLVIPKHHAQTHLPNIAQEGGEIMLSFEDANRDRVWRFKYCYWKSSQNYVLTKGWGEFVKDKGLKPGDTVLFYCTTLADSHKKFSIDTTCKEAIVKDVVSSDSNDNVAMSSSKVLLRLFGVDICSSVRHVPVPIPVVVCNNISGNTFNGKSTSSCTQIDSGEVFQSQGCMGLSL